MIKEDYVSFEIAKLLKEKGFDSNEVGRLGGFYSERCYEPGRGIITQSGQEVGIVYDNLTNSDLEYDEYLRPTLQMAMKWLREVHTVDIVITPSMFRRKYNVHIFKDENLCCVDFDGATLSSSYEQACEAAIKYCLENLI